MLGLKMRPVGQKLPYGMNLIVIQVLRSTVVVSTTHYLGQYLMVTKSSVDIWPFLFYVLGSQVLEVRKLSTDYKA